MSTAIVRQDQVVASLDDVQRTAKLLAMSNYFDAKGDSNTAIAQIATKILAGREMGYGPFASVQGIHVIQGKPVISANLMAAAVKRGGRYDYRVRKLDTDGCEIEFFQRTGEKLESVGKSAFLKDDAKAAGLLNKDNWQKFARNMYFARAMSNGIRFFCPDVFDGNTAYTPDELGAAEDADGNVIDVTPTVTKPETPPTAVSDAAFKAFMATGSKAFGADWNEARHWLIERYTSKDTPTNIRTSAKTLTHTELDALTVSIDKWNGRLVEQWQQHKAQQQAELDAINMADVPELAGGEAVAA
jgi:hypothetical protein